MNNPTKSYLFLAILLTLIFLNSSTGLSKDNSPKPLRAKREVRVLVYNYTNLPAAELRIAKERAGRILTEAGIEVFWIDKGSENADNPSQPGGSIDLDQVNYFVRILPKSREVLKTSALGEALPCKKEMGGCYANLFLNRVQERAEFGRIGIEEVLGHAIAHELGHLLMGFNSHYSNGIMRAQWGPEELKQAARGDLLFTPEQVQRIYRNIAISPGDGESSSAN